MVETGPTNKATGSYSENKKCQSWRGLKEPFFQMRKLRGNNESKVPSLLRDRASTRSNLPSSSTLLKAVFVIASGSVFSFQHILCDPCS